MQAELPDSVMGQSLSDLEQTHAESSWNPVGAMLAAGQWTPLAAGLVLLNAVAVVAAVAVRRRRKHSPIVASSC